MSSRATPSTRTIKYGFFQSFISRPSGSFWGSAGGKDSIRCARIAGETDGSPAFAEPAQEASPAIPISSTPRSKYLIIQILPPRPALALQHRFQRVLRLFG